MKKALMIIAAMFVSVASFAQKEAGTFSFIPKVGISYTNMSNDQDKINFDSKLGFTAGAEAEYQISETFSVSLGAMYTQKGLKYDNYGAQTKWKLDYLDVPVMANAYIVPGLALKVGVQPEILLSSKYGGTAEGHSMEWSTKDDCKSFLVSLPIGVSYEYKNVMLDLRYTTGLMNAFKSETKLDAKHQVLSLTLGYRF